MINKDWHLIIDTREKPKMVGLTKKILEVESDNKVDNTCDDIWFDIAKESLQGRVEVKRATMTVGDFGARDNDTHKVLCAFERKSVADLVGSIISRNAAGQPRLFDQIRRLTTLQPKSGLLISGSIDEFENIIARKKLKLNRYVAYGAISSIAVAIPGFPVLWCWNDVDLINIVYKMCDKVVEGKWNQGVDFKPKWQTDPRDILRKFPGIKKKTTIKDLLKVGGGTLRGVLNLSEEELKKVDGIGPARAKDLFAKFNKEYK